MVHVSTSLSHLVGFVLLALLVVPSAFAQADDGQREQAIEQKVEAVTKRLEAVDQDEAVKVMEAAVRHNFSKPVDRYPRYVAERVKVDPEGFVEGTVGGLSGKALPESVSRLAERLATALGVEIESFEPGDPDKVGSVFVATSIPKMQGAEARLKVRRWSPTSVEQYGELAFGYKLKRRADGTWHVTEDLSFEHSNIIDVAGRVTDDTDIYPFAAVDQKPELIGGEHALYRKLQFPESARGSVSPPGTVYLQFTVDAKGQVRDLTVLRSPHDALSEEAKRVFGTMRFRPGRWDGEAVPVRMSMPIRFGRLEGSN